MAVVICRFTCRQHAGNTRGHRGLEIHEAIGELTVSLVRPFVAQEYLTDALIQTLGEAAVHGGIVGVCFLAIIYFYRSSDSIQKKFTHYLGASFIAIGLMSISAEQLGLGSVEELIEIIGLTLLLVVCIIFYRTSHANQGKQLAS